MSNRSNPNLNPELEQRNQETEARHKREVFWQITFPLFLLAILFTLAAALPVIALIRNNVFGIWRDIALIWLLTPNLILAILILVVLGGAVYGVIWVIGKLPKYFYLAQQIFAKIQNRSTEISNRIAAPIIKIGGINAAIGQLTSRSHSNQPSTAVKRYLKDEYGKHN